MHLDRLTYEEFIQHGISEMLARALTLQQHPIKNFDIFVRPISPSWNYFVPRHVTEVVGLWACNADAYCRWTRDKSYEFVHLPHDDPEYWIIAYTEQGLLAELVRRYYEHLDWQDESGDLARVRAFADYVGFQYTSKVDEYMRTEGDAPEFMDIFGRLA